VDFHPRVECFENFGDLLIKEAVSLKKMARDEAEAPVIFQLLAFLVFDKRSARAIDRSGAFFRIHLDKGGCALRLGALVGEGDFVRSIVGEPRRCEDLAGPNPSVLPGSSVPVAPDACRLPIAQGPGNIWNGALT